MKEKKSRKDVQGFQRNLMTNIITLHQELANRTYKHSAYEAFKVYDPKPRDIHKATVRDRVLHRALYRTLYPFFDRIFIHDSYSCRFNKGTHKAIYRFRSFIHQVSEVNTKMVWVLKCDIRKFFASVDQNLLLELVARYIPDKDIITLLTKVVRSFSSKKIGIGLPLGNLTSQLLVNIYLNEFDQFIKHKMKCRYYIRYADDFVILSQNREWLVGLISQIQQFLYHKLHLELHPDKVSINTIASGVDYLGWVNFPKHITLRTGTKKRMFRNILQSNGEEKVVQSYLGLLSHGSCYKLKRKIEKSITTTS